MTTVPINIVTPSGAADAYNRVERGGVGNSTGTGDFGGALQRALQGAVDNVRAADTKAMEALSGGGNLTEVVSAIARAELTLQTATTVRDRVVQAYQDIMKMPI